jgi:hypothetical protein
MRTTGRNPIFKRLQQYRVAKQVGFNHKFMFDFSLNATEKDIGLQNLLSSKCQVNGQGRPSTVNSFEEEEP